MVWAYIGEGAPSFRQAPREFIAAQIQTLQLHQQFLYWHKEVLGGMLNI